MKKGTLYGVGVGPGDPELVTQKAVNTLKKADVIAVPVKGGGEKTALNIVKDIVAGKHLIYCQTPMVRDKARLNEAYDRIASEVCAQLDAGHDVAFITLGDPTVYSTYIYVHKRVLARGYTAQLVPGVTSFCAAAARLNMSLCEGAQRLMVVPASHEGIEHCLDTDANLVFMKAGREIGALKEKLDQRGLLERAAMVENCGMENERIFKQFSNLEGDSGYFSVVLVKSREGEA